jgi:hypothetical protein
MNRLGREEEFSSHKKMMRLNPSPSSKYLREIVFQTLKLQFGKKVAD